MFTKVLIANRGEIAVRVARTCQRLGVATVGVYSEADAQALHPSVMTESRLIGPAPVRESYLNAEAIIETALSTGAQAIHPGYGLLSERSSFARAVIEAGLTWIGPNPEVLDKLGDKMRARHTALAAGVSPVPGAHEPVETIDVAREVIAEIGYPALVKAVGGGGGIGMQVVRDDTQLERAMKSCSDRAAAAFGDSRVYIERYVEAPRHIEVQIFGDRHGAVVALGERECSLQRRHQKIVEESPSPTFMNDSGPAVRTALLDAAVRIGKTVGYSGAGTCEFIWDDSRREFYFLEVNCRIQVEHAVTELVTGLDLVEHQLRVASGEPLASEVKHCVSRGHAIEARLCAEDPSRGFIPKPGDVDTLTWPALDNVRIDPGVRAPGKVTPYYDSMIAKVIAWADNRPEAIDRLDTALAQTTIGPVVTNQAFLRAVLRSDDFSRGQYDTTFAERFAKKK